MRIVYLGTSEFAASVLRALATGPHRPQLVLTRPDRPRGRGRRLACPPVATCATELGLALSQPASVNTPQTVAEIDATGAQVIVVCAFGALIREPLLSSRPILNVHPSLLPRWRGAAPIERAIIAGDDRTGVSIMRLTAGLDSGPVCFAAPAPIAADDDYGSLSRRLSDLAGELIDEALDRLDEGSTLPFEDQDDSQATYAEKIGREDRLLHPSVPAAELARVVRALRPHVGAVVRRPDGEQLRVSKARVVLGAGADASADASAGAGASADADASAGADAGADADAATGLVGDDGRLLLRTVDGDLELLEVQPPGGRPMEASAYLRGHAL